MPNFEGTRVLVTGDLMLDRYWYGPVSRISPEAPVPVVAVEHIEERAGGAGNVALNIAAVGGTPLLLGQTGADREAEVLLSSLRAAGVDCTLVWEDGSRATIVKLRVVSRHQQLIRLDFESPQTPQTEGATAEASQGMAQALSTVLDTVGAVVVSDYCKGGLPDPAPLIRSARAAGVPVLVDPKGGNFDRYRGANLLTPNLREFEAVAGPCGNDERRLAQRGLALAENLQLDALLVTRGEYGVTLLRPGQPELHLPARAREVFDVTGAGDTVIAVLAAALVAGEDLPHAVALANIAAGIAVGKFGTVAVSGPELRREVLRELGSERGVVNQEQLRLMVEDARAHNERIVMTNGCFDIIHAGHVACLEQSATLGDRLIVAVNSDESVHRLKGEGRPVNPLERRMAVLAGLESVDWVVPFEEDTPENLLQSVRPDVLTKGGDYKPEQVVGKEIVEGYGGEVTVLEHIEDCSTSAMIEKRGG